MSPDKQSVFSDDEKDILQEIMNIAFGSATADLADVVDIYVVLSVPNIEVLDIGQLPDYIRSTINASVETGVVEQKFWGDFNGSGLLVFPKGTGSGLMEQLGKDESPENVSDLEKGMLVEIGNILIGACVGKVSELLETYVTYTPPQALRGAENDFEYLIKHYDSSSAAIVMKTVFTFEKEDVSGILLILTNNESIDWLRRALNDFMESYE